MAEKEERQKRLLIKEYDLVCDLTDCKYCEEKDWCSEKDGMTRQEAIERMALSMFEWQRPGSGGDVPIEDVWQNEKCGFENLAEVALDALLSGVE